MLDILYGYIAFEMKHSQVWNHAIFKIMNIYKIEKVSIPTMHCKPKDMKILKIISNYGDEFENKHFEIFCETNKI